MAGSRLNVALLADGAANGLTTPLTPQGVQVHLGSKDLYLFRQHIYITYETMQILTPLLFMTIGDKNFYLGLFYSGEASTRRIPIFIARAQVRILHLIVADHNSRQMLGLGETVSEDDAQP